MRRHLSALWMLLLVAGAACSQSPSPPAQNPAPSAAALPAADSAAWTGVFGTRLPAASSPGREVVLLLRADSSAILHTDYLNGEAPVVTAGTWLPADTSSVRLRLAPPGSHGSLDEMTLRRSGDTLTATRYDEERYGRSGLTLARRTAPELAGTSWRAVAILGQDALADPVSTVTFEADGTLTGRGACNSFGGTYELAGARLSTSQLFATRMACAEAVMDQEQRFLAALEGAEYAILSETGALWLYSSGEAAPSQLHRLDP